MADEFDPNWKTSYAERRSNMRLAVQTIAVLMVIGLGVWSATRLFSMSEVGKDDELF